MSHITDGGVTGTLHLTSTSEYVPAFIPPIPKVRRWYLFIRRAGQWTYDTARPHLPHLRPFLSRISTVEGLRRTIEEVKQWTQNEAALASYHFGKSAHLKMLTKLVRRAIRRHFPFLHIQAEPEQNPNPPPLSSSLSGIARMRAELVQALSLTNHDEGARLLVPENLRRLSTLKKKHQGIPLRVDPRLISDLFGLTKEACEFSPALMAYLDNFLTRKNVANPLRKEIQDAFSAAIKRQADLIGVIATGDQLKDKPNDALKRLAIAMCAEVQKLSVGQSYLHYSNLAKVDRTRTPSFVHNLLKNKLPPEFIDLIEGNDPPVAEAIKEHLLASANIFSVIPHSKDISDASTIVRETSSNMATFIENLSPNFYKSLKEDLRDLAIGEPPANGELRRADHIWKCLQDQGIERVLDEEIARGVTEARNACLSHIDEAVERVTTQLPRNLLQAASAMGFDIQSDERFWVEIEKQSNGQYTVILFSNEVVNTFNKQYKIGEEQGYHLPLVFRHVQLHQIEDLFQCLLSYQAWSTWEKVTYSMSNVHMGMRQILGEEAPSEASTIYPKSMPLTNHFADWLQLYLYHHMGVSHARFIELMRYELPLEILNNYWPTVITSPSILRNTVHRESLSGLLDQLADFGIERYKKDKDFNAFKTLYATIWEAQEAINAAQKAQQKSMEHPSMILPPALHELLTTLIETTGVTQMHIESLREVCIDSFGNEFAETFDLILKDLVLEVNEKLGPPKAWSEIFQWPSITDSVYEGFLRRKSLLYACRLYIKQRQLINAIVGFSISAKLIEVFLTLLCPQLGLFSYISTSKIAHLLVFFGPDILQKILPTDMYETVNSIFSLYNEIGNYILQRIASKLTHSLVHYLLKPEGLKAFNEAAKQLAARLTKEGTISYEHFKLHPHKQLITIPAVTQQKPASITGSPTKDRSAGIQSPEASSPHLQHPFWKLVSWSGEYDKILREATGSYSDAKRKALVYLNAQIRTLPVPPPMGSGEGSIWTDEIPGSIPADSIIRRFEPLLLRLQQHVTSSIPGDDSNEYIISIYTLYAIIDTLARKNDPFLSSPFLLPNGAFLGQWMSKLGNNYPNPISYKRLCQVATYFHLDPMKVYSDSELDSYETDRLFNWEGHGTPGRAVMIASNKLSPYGAWGNPEGDYYGQLLEQPEVKQAVDLYFLYLYGKTDQVPEEQQRLLNSLSSYDRLTLFFTDPSIPPTLAQKGMTSGHLMPDPIHYLRLVHLLAQEATTHASIRSASNTTRATRSASNTTRATFSGDPIMLTPVKATGNDGTSLLPTSVAEVGNALFHLVTFNARIPELQPIIPLIPPKLTQADRLITRLAFERLFSACNTGLGKLTDERAQAVHEIIKHFPTRTQSQIMVSPPITGFQDLLSREEVRELEMIGTYGRNQVSRWLSFWTRSRRCLSDYRCRFLFALQINDLVALRAQYKDSPDIIKHLDIFFKETLDYFARQHDWGTYLFIATTGHQVATQCRYFSPEAFSVDFVAGIRAHVISHYSRLKPAQRRLGEAPDGLYVAYSHITASHMSLLAQRLEPELRTQVMLDIGRWHYSSLPRKEEKDEIELRSEAVAIHFLLSIQEAIKTDAEFRNTLLDNLLEDDGIDPKKFQGRWEGTYPHYQKGPLDRPAEININLEKREAIATKKFATQTTIAKIGFDPGQGVQTNRTTYYAEQGITVVDDGGQPKIFRILFGQSYRLIEKLKTSDVPLGPKDAAWMSQSGDPHLLVTRNGRPHQRMTLTTTDAEDKYAIIQHHQYGPNNTLIEVTHLQNCEHQLHLLRGFHSSPQLLVGHEKGEIKLEGITFPGTGLQFLIRPISKENPEKRAYNIDPQASEDFIAPQQRDPRLVRYGQYLLITNDKGHKKVYLRAFSPSKLFALTITHFVDNSLMSPFIESIISDYLSKDAEGYYSYSLNEQGKLETTDRASLIYLMLFLVHKNETEEAMNYLPQLQLMGSIELTQDALDALDAMLMSLFLNMTPEANKLILQLTALRETYELSDKPSSFPAMSLFKSLIVQFAYSDYLRKIQPGYHYEYLCPQDESLIFDMIEDSNEDIKKKFLAAAQTSLQSIFGKDTKLSTLLEQGGYIERLMKARIFMEPYLLHRYVFLQAQRGTIRPRQTAETLFLEMIHASDTTDVAQTNYVPQQIFNFDTSPQEITGGFSNLLSAYHTLSTHPLCCSWTEHEMETFTYKLILTADPIPIALELLTPSYITKHFLLFYRLASNKIPPSWRGDPVKENWFRNQVDSFIRYKALFSGTSQVKLENISLAILFAVASTTGFGQETSYSPDKLDQLFQNLLRYRQFSQEKSDLTQRLNRAQPSDIGPIQERIQQVQTEIDNLLHSPECSGTTPLHAFATAFGSLVIDSRVHTAVKGAFKIIESYIPKTFSSLIDRAGELAVQHLTPFAIMQMFEGIGNAAKRTEHQQKLAQQQLTEYQKQALVDTTSLLDPLFVTEMMAIEDEISSSQKRHLDEHFISHPAPTTATSQIVPFDHVQTNDPSVIHEFTKVNESIHSLNEKRSKPPIEKEFLYTLKPVPPDKEKDFQNEIVIYADSVRSQLLLLQRQIEHYVNYRFTKDQSEEQAILNGFVERRTQRPQMTFGEIREAFLQGKENTLLKRTFMGKEHLPTIKLHLYIYFIILSRHANLFKAIAKHIEDKSPPNDWENLGSILAQTRGYSLEESMPERFIMGLLSFESQNGLLRKKSIPQMRNTLAKIQASEKPSFVVELKPGDGKTWLFDPLVTWFMSNGFWFCNVVWTDQMWEEHMPKTVKSLQTSFALHSSALSLTRNSTWTPKMARKLRSLYERARVEKTPIHSKKYVLPCTELIKLEQLRAYRMTQNHPDPQKKRAGQIQFIETVCDILLMTRLFGVMVGDEFHELIAFGKQLNHPTGRPHSLDSCYIAVMQNVTAHLGSPEFQTILRLKQIGDNPKIALSVPSKLFMSQIAVPLARKVVSRWDIPKKDQEIYVQYLSGQLTHVPSQVRENENLSEIDLAKGMIETLLRTTLEQVPHVDYVAPEEDITGETQSSENALVLQRKGILPSEGNMNPQKGSFFLSCYEDIIKNQIMALYDRLKESQVKEYLAYLKAEALTQHKETGCPIQNTKAARFFKTHFPDRDLMACQESDPGLVDLFNSKDEVVLSYVSDIIAPGITYYDYNSCSTSTDWASMYASSIGFTGTPSNAGTYPLKTEVLYNPGTVAESIEVLERPGKVQVDILDRETPLAILNEILQRYFLNPKCRALIDCGAVLNGLKNHFVAIQLYLYALQNRSDIDAIIYYEEGKEMILVIDRKSSTLFQDSLLKPVPFKGQIPVERCLVYFPQPNSFGTHRPIDLEDVFAILTLTNNTHSSLQQAQWRLRGLETHDQGIVLAVTKHIRDLISTESTPTLRKVEEFTIHGEGSLQGAANYEAALQQFRGVTRRSALDAILTASTIDEMARIEEEFDDCFFESTPVYPTGLFGGQSVELDPIEVFNEKRKQEKARIDGSEHLKKEEKEAAKTNLDAIGQRKYLDKVHVRKVDGALSTLRIGLGQTAHVTLSQQQDAKQQVNQTITMHQQEMIVEDTNQASLTAQKFCAWYQGDPKELARKLDWYTASFKEAPPRLGEVIPKGWFDWVRSKTPELNKPIPDIFSLKQAILSSTRPESMAIADKIPDNIRITNNMAYLVADNGCQIEPFGPQQIPIQEVLIICEMVPNKPCNCHVLIINQLESMQWRQVLEKDIILAPCTVPKVKIGIYDLTIGQLLQQGANAITPKELGDRRFQSAFVKLKFLRGEVQYTEEEVKILNPWLQTSLPSFKKYSEWIRKHHAIGRYSGSTLETIFTTPPAKTLIKA
jgi:hypothetical protein